MIPAFKLPDGFQVPPSADGEDFEVLATLRRLPNGEVSLVAVDGTDIPASAEPEVEEDETATATEIPEDASALEAIESRLEGVSPADIDLSPV